VENVYEDAFNLLCGRLIGEGAYRKVFECLIRQDLVVKVEIDTGRRNFMNVLEMEFWRASMYNKSVASWLAPCEHLSPDGRILLQRRCEGIGRTFLPDKLPKFLADIKQENFGYYEGRVVCVDYAGTIVSPSVKMIQIKEWR
jgi:hypothetical protein